MLFKIYTDTKESTPEAILKPLCEALHEGEVIIIPTDTRYSICCDALNGRSLEHLADLKGVDPKKHRFSILCNNLSQVSQYAKVSDDIFRVMKANTPGPFTFVLPTGTLLPSIYKGRKEVGVRIPDFPFVHHLIEYFGKPITGFSLPLLQGKEDEAYRYHPELIQEGWQPHVAHIVDGGVGTMSVSAIIDCTATPFQILREGPRQLIL